MSGKHVLPVRAFRWRITVRNARDRVEAQISQVQRNTRARAYICWSQKGKRLIEWVRARHTFFFARWTAGFMRPLARWAGRDELRGADNGETSGDSHASSAAWLLPLSAGSLSKKWKDDSDVQKDASCSAPDSMDESTASPPTMLVLTSCMFNGRSKRLLTLGYCGAATLKLSEMLWV